MKMNYQKHEINIIEFDKLEVCAWVNPSGSNQGQSVPGTKVDI